jgi:primary-amine oxidase
MTRQPRESSSSNAFLSRRGFLKGVATTAGTAALGRLFEYPACASEATLTPMHPLDPLSAGEMASAVRVLRDSRRLGRSFRFVSCALDEPDLAAMPGPHRRAFLVLLENRSGRGYEAVVDLGLKSVVRFDPLPPGVQPAVMLDEFRDCEELVKRSPAFKAALKKRGLAHVDLIMVEPWSAGNYGTEPASDRDRRLLRALCFVRSEPGDNGYARPLDGIVAVVDLNSLEVLRIEDHGVVPLPPEAANWSRQYVEKFREAPAPLEIVQKKGPGFTVDGHRVRWQNWSFRLGFNQREGLVLHAVSYNDAGVERSILKRASICEMVVPYSDPAELYYRKNAFDIGEYGIGTLANSLSLGCDCLGSIRYFDVNMLDSRGSVVTLRNVICLHEEDDGLLWKHTDWRTNQSETRRSRRLSASFIATVGNYEYAFYWHFYQDGSLACEIKLTGVMNTTALAPGQKPTFGVEIAPQLNAPFHQHFFAARLHMAVDGNRNSVYEVNTSGVPPGALNPHGNAFRAVATLLATEKQAQRSMQMSSGRFWRITSSSAVNRLGVATAYRLVPGENSVPFSQPDASVSRRAGFTAYHLWVTPYHRAERYAAGDYPNQHPGGDGLPRWTAANRKITDTDLVVWYVFSHLHIPRMEDWPVMPACSIGFHLKPDGFFSRNPALNLPPP